MTTRRRRPAALLAAVLAALPALATPARPAAAQPPATPPAAAPDTSWDVTRPRGRTRQIDFRTSEGTWMTVDATPDGRWIVFDLLGHVYRVPAAGGDAESLTQESGIAVNFHPRVSPDGRSIAFISDRKGSYAVWVMDIDGRNPRLVAGEPTTRLMFPDWTADGRFIIAERSTQLFDRALWMYHRDGGGGTELVKGEPGRLPGRPVASLDGKAVYYDVYTGRFAGSFGTDDILRGAYQLARLDLATGDTRMVTSGVSEQQNRGTSGGAYAAEPSPDGRSLAFVRRVPDGTTSYKGHKFGPRSSLWVRDLATGAERMVMDPVELDQAEAGIPVDGTYPHFRWTRDGRSILILQGGKIRRLDVETGRVATIPFTAHVRREISEQALASFRVSDDPLAVRFLRWQSRSPDGRRLLFQAVGRVWVADLPNGTPRRITPAGFDGLEYAPAWSPDGRAIAFVSWDDARRGHLWRADVAGGRIGAPVRLTRAAGEYVNPTFTPDGREIVVLRGGGVTAQGRTLARNAYFDLVRLPAAGGAETVVTRVDAAGGFASLPRATFGPDGRLFFHTTRPMPGPDPFRPRIVAELTSVRLDGTDRQAHVQVAFGDELTPSPDGRWVAFVHAGDLFVAPLPFRASGGATPVIDKAGGAVPVRRLTTTGGMSPRWRGPTTLDYGSARRIYTYDLATQRAESGSVALSVPRNVPRGSIALTGARIVTLDQRRVIENGTVVVRANRIACVGDCPTTGVDRVVDARGATIIPGWIDMHAHHHNEHLGITPAHNFESAIYLAYGVTTTLDPATWSPAAFSNAEMVEAGELIGPRMFATAEPFYAGEGPAWNDVTSLEVAAWDAERRKDWGAVSVKQYLQPTRQQRQWVVEAGRRAGLRVTAEGSMDLNHKLGLAMDGHTGFEHALALTPLYGDVTTFLGHAKTFNSYTPLVGGFGPWNEEYYWQESELRKDPKAQRWLPWRHLIPHTRRHTRRPVTDYPLAVMAQGIADVTAAGGFGAVGSHGQQHGLGSHWDVWTAALAMPPMQALEMASVHGARFLGMEQDLGSIAVGKIADLVVLDANPLENIRNTTRIRQVMRGGVLYDAQTLDELWPRARKFGDYYWVQPEMYLTDDKPVDIWDRR